MSVAAVVTYRPGQDGPSYLPVATEEAFRRTWLPLAKAAGLELVPRFAEGLTVEPRRYAALEAELSTLRARAADAAGDPADLAQLVTRVTLLAVLLRDLAALPAGAADLYIG